MNEPTIADRIVATAEYQRGDSLTVKVISHRLKLTLNQAKSGIRQLCEEGRLAREVRGNVTHYFKPKQHWIHRRRLTNRVNL